MAKAINHQFRILYALGITFVLLGHLGGRTFTVMTDWFPWYLFHLGLFAFASGYFFSPARAAHPVSYLAHKVRTLLVPLYLWNCVYAVVALVLGHFGFTFVGTVSLRALLLRPILDGHQFGLNLGGWFVVPLFMCHVYAVAARLIPRRVHNDFVYMVVGIVIGIAGITLARHDFRTGWWLVLTRFMYFVPFYELGICYRARLEKIDTAANGRYFAIVLCAQLALIFVLRKIPVCTPCWSTFPFGAVPTLLGGFLATAFWLRVARILVPVCAHSRIVELVGGNTFSIMMHHNLGFFCLKTAFALAHKFAGLCHTFDWQSYKTNIWYVFLPHHCNQMVVLYLAAGIVVSIVIQRITKVTSAWIFSNLKKSLG